MCLRMDREHTAEGKSNRIVVLNPKGGCGKSTLATNLAACYVRRGNVACHHGLRSTGFDDGMADPPAAGTAQDSRDSRVPNSMQATRSWQLRVPHEVETLIVDSPAAISHDDLRELTRELFQHPRARVAVRHGHPRRVSLYCGPVAGGQDQSQRTQARGRGQPTKKNTKSFGKLMRFLDSLGIPIIAVLRDSQNYVHGAEFGIGVHEMPASRVADDIAQIDRVVQWLDDWEERRRQAVEFTNITRAPCAGLPVLLKPQLSSA